MGFNSLLFIPNDQLSTVSRHPEQFAKEVVGACGSMGHGRLPGRFNNFSVPYIGHMDSFGVVGVGGNHAETMLQFHMGAGGHHTDESKHVALLRLAADLGYSVRKKKQ